jgi:hypothetical protein
VRAGGVLVVLPAGSVVVVRGDPTHDAPAAFAGELGQGSEQGVGCAGSSGVWVDVEVVQVPADGCGRGAGEGPHVSDPEEVPVDVMSDEPLEFAGGSISQAQVRPACSSVGVRP